MVPWRLDSVKEEEVIDLTTSDFDDENDEEDDYNNEDDDNGFIDDEDDDSNDNDSLDVNDFFMEMKVGLAYSARGRALCKWDQEFWHG